MTTVEAQLARRAGALAAQLGRPLACCPYDPASDPLLAMSFIRGWRSAGVAIAKAAAPDGGGSPKADAPTDQRWPGWAQDLAIAAAVSAALMAALTAGAASLAAVRALAHQFADWAQGWRPSDPRPDVLGWLRANTDLGPRIEHDIRQVIEDAWLQGYMVGWRSAGAVVGNLAAGIPPRDATRVDVDWGGWTPGDVSAARRIMTADGSIEPWLQLLRDAGITIKRIADNRLQEVAKCLAEGLQRGASVDEIARDLQRTVADPKWCYKVAVTETNRALSAATLDTYEIAGVGASEWMTALDQRVCVKICARNEAAGPVRLGERFPSGDYHPPGHPHCRCALVPALLDELLKAAGMDWRAYNAAHPKGPWKDSRGRWTRSNGASLAAENPLAALDWLELDEEPAQPPKPAERATARIRRPAKALPKKRRPVGSWEARIASGVSARRMLSNDDNTGHVELVTFGDGTRAVYKRGRGNGISLEEDHDAEELAYPIAKLLGLNPPEVHRESDDEAYFTYVEGVPIAMEIIPMGDWDPASIARHRDGAAGRRMALLDTLIDNADRNLGNWFAHPDGSITPIDHGHGWTAPRSPWNKGAGGEKPPIPNDFNGHYIYGKTWRDTDLSPEWLQSLRPKLEAMRPAFARLGHEDWLEFTLERLDALKAHAKGTVTL